MKIAVLLLTMIMFFTLSACAKRSPDAQKMEAEAEYTEEKTKTLQEYKQCVKNSGTTTDKMKQCDALLNAIHAAEGTTPPKATQASEPATSGQQAAQETESAATSGQQTTQETEPVPPGQ